MPTTTKTVTILAGESVSDAVDVAGMLDIYIVAPPEWDGANLTFQFSPDGGADFYDLVDEVGNEVMLGMSGRVNTVTHLSAKGETAKLPNVGQLKFRSGARNNPVVQRDAREFKLTIFT